MFCPHCGKEFLPDANFCSACGKVPAFQAPRPTRIVRPREFRVLAGVCAGFASHYGWDLAVTRILFVVLTLFTFPICIFVYIAAWIMLPDAPFALPQYAGQYAGAYSAQPAAPTQASPSQPAS